MLKKISILIVLCMFQYANAQDHKPIEASVRVHCNNGKSSGVIVSAHNEKIIVISTGHMKDRNNPEIEIFYLNHKKLETPIKVTGRILTLTENGFNGGVDFSVIEANLKTEGISFIPLAPENITLETHESLTSIGCDLGTEPTIYDVKMKNYQEKKGDLQTDGKAQAGRSGGGLFTKDNKYLVGICWGGHCTEPIIFHTTHKTINSILKTNYVSWD